VAQFAYLLFDLDRTVQGSDLDITVFGADLLYSEYPGLVAVFYVQGCMDWGWIALLVVLTVHLRSAARSDTRTRPAWLVASIAWSLGELWGKVSWHGLKLFVPEDGWAGTPDAIAAAALFLAIGLLCRRSRFALLPLCIIVLARAFSAGQSWYGWWFTPPSHYSQTDIAYYRFWATLAWPVYEVAPWLLIAWYAWRHLCEPCPTTGPPFLAVIAGNAAITCTGSRPTVARNVAARLRGDYKPPRAPPGHFCPQVDFSS
jgi:hypothetical protein